MQSDLRSRHEDLFAQAAAQTAEEHDRNPLYTEDEYDAVINHVRQWLFAAMRRYRAQMTSIPTVRTTNHLPTQVSPQVETRLSRIMHYREDVL